MSFEILLRVGVPNLAAAARVTLMLSSTTAALLPLLPLMRPAGGGTDHFPMPAAVSGGIPSAYLAFTVSVIFAFTCSVSAVFLEKKPPASTLFCFSAIASLSSATVLFLYSVFVGGSP